MLNRRSFVKKSVLSSFAAIVGAEIVFGSNMIDGYTPLALQEILGAEIVFGSNMIDGYTPLALQEPDPFKLFKKNNEMVVLNDKPWNIEAKAHLLDDKVTPNSSMFIRNNGKIPENINADNWKLVINGESVKQQKTYTLQELKSKFKLYTYQLTLECGGNGRSEFNPPAKGNQWTVGAVY